MLTLLRVYVNTLMVGHQERIKMALHQDDVAYIRKIVGDGPVTIFLIGGIKLQGQITYWGDRLFGFTRDGATQVIMHKSIATILPNDANGNRASRLPEKDWVGYP